MGYIPKELILKAYKSLSMLTDDHKQGQTQYVSAIRHLVALDMFFKENEENCDLDFSENRDAFTENVKEIVNVEGNYYTTNFYTNIKDLEDCGVGSNFYSAGVVNNSKQNKTLAYDYPTRGQFPLFKVKSNSLIREEAYLSNVRNYLKNQELRCAFVVWLLRKKVLDSLNCISIKKKLQGFLTPELVDALMPKDEKLNTYVEHIELGQNPAIVTVKDLLGLFDDKLNNKMGTLDGKYRPYITAIKSKPFLLLAGVSGTGKSRIVRELARACWDEGSEEYKAQKPRNFEMVQVKPNWHDSSELIGYVSRIGADKDGNGVVFVAGDFLKFVARAWEEPEIPYFLCLDEMNLAPVEQYFAEYLSVVESRNADENGIVTTDPILKKVSQEWYWKLCSELTSKETLREQFRDHGISLPQNLIVVGTVNMDETTFSFSRKVLDRAMTIEMNEVNLKGGLRKRHEEIGKLGAEDLIGNAVEGVDVFEDFHDECKTTINYLQAVNDVLEGTPFKIAYRTRNEFLLYVVNNLPYRKDDESEEFVIARALDEMTCMKILSRIEGDADKIGNLLEQLSSVIKEQLGDGFTKENSVSLKKLSEMENRLKSGYTSFWS